MAKASSPGRTKTRLVPPLSFEEAAELNTAFIRDVAANLIEAGTTAPIRGYMAYGPAGTDAFFRDVLPPGIGLIESWIGPFGECLLHAVEALFGLGHGAACVLNADSPTLPTSLLVELAEALSAPGDRAVLGPSEDGGYYVLGLKAAHRRMFEDIDWSTERVADQTRARAREIGLPVHVLPAWYDVDDAATLARLRDEVNGRRPAAGLVPFGAEHTRRALGALADRALASSGAARHAERTGADR